MAQVKIYELRSSLSPKKQVLSEAIQEVVMEAFGLPEITLRTTGVSPWVKAFQPQAGKEVEPAVSSIFEVCVFV